VDGWNDGSPVAAVVTGFIGARRFVDPACVRGVLGDYAPLLAATDSVASHTVPGEHRQHRPSKPTCSNMASASFVAFRIRREPRQLAASTRRTLLGSATNDSTAMVDSACHDHSTGYTHRPQRLEVLVGRCRHELSKQHGRPNSERRQSARPGQSCGEVVRRPWNFKIDMRSTGGGGATGR